jgi:hypothetical protein
MPRVANQKTNGWLSSFTRMCPLKNMTRRTYVLLVRSVAHVSNGRWTTNKSGEFGEAKMNQRFVVHFQFLIQARKYAVNVFQIARIAVHDQLSLA